MPGGRHHQRLKDHPAPLDGTAIVKNKELLSFYTSNSMLLNTSARAREK